MKKVTADYLQFFVFQLFPLYDANSNVIANDPLKKFPIGVFWDIENCQVPFGKSAIDIVQKIRSEFFSGLMLCFNNLIIKFMYKDFVIFILILILLA